ncbi:hypothetical protein HYPP_02884 [Hyphomicrobium sp. ghe19]|nr:hypothetical protein HYPP_02884 [Hyphomicrobium sp. ghe19]
MLSIDFESPKFSKCPCCGTTTTTLTRFVYRDGNAHAIYYAAFTEGHTDRTVRALVSIGGWGNEGTSDQRIAMVLKLWADETEFGATVLDAENSLWSGSPLLGRILDRAEALAHPSIGDVFCITDRIVAEDSFVRSHLERTH